MPFYVYILYSKKLNRFYTGTTDDVSGRVVQHNSGKYPGAFTLKGIPWDLFLSVECSSSQQAYLFEAFIKKMKSSAFIKRLKAEPVLIEQILKKLV